MTITTVTLEKHFKQILGKGDQLEAVILQLLRMQELIRGVVAQCVRRQ